MDFPQKLLALRQSLGLTQEEMAVRMGISSNYVSLLEKGKKDPSDAISRHVDLIDRMTRAGMQAAAGIHVTPGDLTDTLALYSSPTTLREEPAHYGYKATINRMIPVLGFAHAGLAENYEEIPEDWQDKVPASIRDPKAFAVRLEGDSMEPKFCTGDVLILKPSGEVYSGCLAVLKLKDDGFVFRRVERRAEFVRLIPLNPQWPTEEMPNEHVTWIFPVWGMFRQILK